MERVSLIGAKAGAGAGAAHADHPPHGEDEHHANQASDSYRSVHFHPMDRASPLAYVTLTWLNPLLRLGIERPLQEEDIPALSNKDRSADITRLFRENYVIPRDGRISVLRGLYKSFGHYSLRMVPLNFIFLGGLLTSPFVVRALLSYVQNHDKTELQVHTNSHQLTDGYVYVILLFTCFGCVSLSAATTRVLATKLCTISRVAMTSAVYRKLLETNSDSGAGIVKANALNLISSDVERLSQCILQHHMLWVSPIALLVSMVLMYNIIGAAGIIGMVLLFLVMPLQVFVANRVQKLRIVLARVTDKRIRCTQECLQGIRVVKLSGWERPFAQKIMLLREEEMSLLRQLLFVRMINNAIMYVVPTTVSFAVFALFVLLGNELTVENVFPTMALLSILRPIVYIFPMAVSMLAEAKMALVRLDTFLNSSSSSRFVEIPVTDSANVTYLDNDQAWAPASGVVKDIHITDAVFDWNQGTRFQLHIKELHIKKGELICVVGRVGQGKSSLVHALVNEMPKVQGQVSTPEALDIAFCGQQPWIQHASVRENILFYSEYDEENYLTAVKVCQLEPDLLVLPNGHDTEIGEQGLNLSGGQKARVALARAVYRCLHNGSHTIILDDVLSAVDAHTAQEITNKCLCGALTYCTRILTLNSHYELLPRADRVVVLEGGNVAYDCRYVQLPDDVKRVYHAGEHSNVKDCKDTPHQSEIVDKPQGSEETKDASAVRGNNGLYTSEDRTIGRVGLGVVLTYFASAYYKIAGDQSTHFGFDVDSRTHPNENCHGILIFSTVILSFVAAELFRVAADFWLSLWSGGTLQLSITVCICTFAGLVIGLVVFAIFRSAYYCNVSTVASQRIHNEQLQSVLKAPLNEYFDVTPIGRTLNRFSKDMDLIDSILPESSHQFLQGSIFILSILALCAYSVPTLVLVFVPLVMYFIRVRQYFAASSRELKRLEAVSRSPIYSHFGETMVGLTHIRAMGLKQTFVERLDMYVDTNAKLSLLSNILLPWLALRGDMISATVIACIGISAVVLSDLQIHTTAALAGLALSSAMQLMGSLQATMSQSVDVETNLTAVERMMYFRRIPQEQMIVPVAGEIDVRSPLHNAEGIELQQTADALNWPQSGAIRVVDLWIRYRPNLPYVLKGVSFEVQPNDKIGICGRTGSGKSTILAAFFRVLIPSQGAIYIDGVDLRTVPLEHLRSKLSIIPQDPVLFNASIRENIDVTGAYSDAAIWDALRASQLDEVVASLPEGLDTIISSQDSLFSAGQRQLLCFARVCVRGSKVVMFDESTSSIDTTTDVKIQHTMRTMLKNCTLLVIAHRISTILDSNKVLLLSDGVAVEFGHPLDLLKDTASAFHALVEAHTRAQTH